VREGRDEAWYQSVKESTPEEELKGLSRDVYMEGEYPRSLLEMLAPPKSAAYFNFEKLMLMQTYSHPPIEEHGVIKIYNKFNGLHKYVAGSDIASGRGGDLDNSVTVIIDVTPLTSKVVAEIITNELDLDAFAHMTMKMLDMYDNPWFNLENNGIGEGFAVIMNNMYPHRRLYFGTDKKKPGLTLHKYNRSNIWNNLRGPIERGELITPSIRGLQDLFDVIIHPGSDGNMEKPHARAGAHDDYVSALAVAWYIKDLAAPSSSNSVVPVAGY
jgi:hypothetical protein